jgi:hypothetical protein
MDDSEDLMFRNVVDIWAQVAMKCSDRTHFTVANGFHWYRISQPRGERCCFGQGTRARLCQSPRADAEVLHIEHLLSTHRLVLRAGRGGLS